MLRKFLYGTPLFALAFGILLISLFESASVKYAFGAAVPTPSDVGSDKAVSVDYYLPFPGTVLPGSLLWPLKAVRDFAWYRLTTNPLKRAEIALLYADKRVGAAQTLFENKNSDMGVTALTKSEKYLEVAFENEEAARKEGMDTTSFLTKYLLSSLKHRQVIDEILKIAPQSARPTIVQTQDYSKNGYKMSRDVLNSKGARVPKSPFVGE